MTASGDQQIAGLGGWPHSIYAAAPGAVRLPRSSARFPSVPGAMGHQLGPVGEGDNMTVQVKAVSDVVSPGSPGQCG